jgi:hypothetical protein
VVPLGSGGGTSQWHPWRMSSLCHGRVRRGSEAGAEGSEGERGRQAIARTQSDSFRSILATYSALPESGAKGARGLRTWGRQQCRYYE